MRIRPTLLLISTLGALAGCSPDKNDASAPPTNADRVAQARERAQALEENAAQLETELARLSGEAAPEPSKERVAPKAVARPKLETVAKPKLPSKPIAAVPKPPAAKPKRPEPKQPTAGELQRALAPGGLLGGRDAPTLDYNGMD